MTLPIPNSDSWMTYSRVLARESIPTGAGKKKAKHKLPERRRGTRVGKEYRGVDLVRWLMTQKRYEAAKVLLGKIQRGEVEA